MCPLCEKETDPAEKIGYTNAKLTIEGIMTKDNKKVKVKMNQQADNRYHAYNGSSLESWSYL